MSLNTVYMVNDVICGAFEHRVGRWQGILGIDGRPSDRYALLVLFKIKNEHVQMLIHAPANYVGVYVRKGKGKWQCICYHDSCWRQDGVDRFLFKHRDNVHFSFVVPFGKERMGITIEHVTDAILVVGLTEEQIKELTQIRERKPWQTNQ